MKTFEQMWLKCFVKSWHQMMASPMS